MTRFLSLLICSTLAIPAAAQTQSLGWAMLKAVPELDVDGDNILTMDEASIATLPEEFDYNGDGSFHPAELTAAYFGLYDLDDNGLLTDDELQAMEGLAAEGVYPLSQ